MNFETNPDNTIYGSYGELNPQNMTDEEWAAYDAHMADEIAKWDTEHEDDYIDFDPEPPF